MTDYFKFLLNYDGPAGFNAGELEWLIADGGWQVSFAIEQHMLFYYSTVYDPAQGSTAPMPPSYFSAITNLIENEVPFWIDLEDCMGSHYHIDPSTNAPEYTSMYYPGGGFWYNAPNRYSNTQADPTSAQFFTDCWENGLATIESYIGNSPYFKGYVYEYGSDMGATWLRNRTPSNLDIMWMVSSPMAPYYVNNEWVQAGPYNDNTMTTEARLAYCVQAVMFEFYVTAHSPYYISTAEWMHEVHPDIPFALLTYLNKNDATNVYPNTYWSTNWLTPTSVSYDQEKVIAETWLHDAHAQIGYSVAGVGTMFYHDSGLSPPATIQEYCGWLDSLKLQDMVPQVMSQYGLAPHYIGASYCKYPLPPDTFTNTGNELILLKDGGTASTHVITVTSTDTFTHEDYTLALSPDRGTFIGPYPLDYYGALPTITYDNTNLYVSVLKVEPYA